jgi:hypothetical protein
MILAMLNPLLRKVVQGAGRTLKKPASFVLAALRGSTYRSVRLASSLAAASLDGLFENPARKNLAVQTYEPLNSRNAAIVFSQPASVTNV